MMFQAQVRRVVLLCFVLALILIFWSSWVPTWNTNALREDQLILTDEARKLFNSNSSRNHSKDADDVDRSNNGRDPANDPRFATLLQCRSQPNPYTQHIRISEIVQNISQPPGAQHFNPTIIALPYWSDNQYLLVSRVVTEGLHQESLLCEANICVGGLEGIRQDNDKDCAAQSSFGNIGGLQCAHLPIVISLPPTPAEQCDGVWSTFPDIPGFHDPRIFWSGKGEPLIIVNSASQYACLGLWIADLRTVYEPLKKLLDSRPGYQYSGPPNLYPQLTELTRNPASSRSPVEKNWFMFFPTPSTSYIHYDLSPPSLPAPFKSTDRGRTFAKLLPDGRTTLNITSLLEQPCLFNEPDARGEPGHWHQATNSLKLILCKRGEADYGKCSADDQGNSVHFAVIHRKFSNVWKLPLRYERYFVVWETRPPFQMLAMSKYPMLFRNETASGWSAHENWAVEMQEELHTDLKAGQNLRWRRLLNESRTINNMSAGHTTRPLDTEDAWLQKDRIYGQSRANWAYFTYTPSIAWAWRPQSRLIHNEDPLEALNVGYLDDEVVLGIGLDDTAQAFARAKAETLLQCMRACSSMKPQPLAGEESRMESRYRHEDELIRKDTENRDFLDV